MPDDTRVKVDIFHFWQRVLSQNCKEMTHSPADLTYLLNNTRNIGAKKYLLSKSFPISPSVQVYLKEPDEKD